MNERMKEPANLVPAAKRKWVGLTDAEISAIQWRPNETLDQYARHIEAKLKEKNQDLL